MIWSYPKALCTQVLDGDTLRLEIDLGFHTKVFKVDIRLLGVDTPELRGPRKDMARKAKETVTALCLGKTVAVDVVQKDKYGGRWLGHIRVLCGSPPVVKDLAAYLIDEGLGVVYSGGKRGVISG